MEHRACPPGTAGRLGRGRRLGSGRSPREGAAVPRFERGVKEAAAGVATDPAADAYSGPLYVYKPAEDGGDLLGARTGPINVVWRADALAGEVTADRVKERMEGPGGWTAPLPTWTSRERYVPVPDGEGPPEPRPSACEVQKQIDAFNPTKQFHVRLYDVADADRRHPVVGQAHWDPTTHDVPVPFTEGPGRFDMSMDAVLDTWAGLGHAVDPDGGIDHPRKSGGAEPTFGGEVDDGRYDTFAGRVGVVGPPADGGA